MNIVNLTPHDINIVTPSGNISYQTIVRSGLVARVSVVSDQVDTINSIPIYVVRYGEVENLPPPQENTIYIVSLLVKQASPRRTDLFSPGELVRDVNGNVIGCKGLNN